ncbi:MAG: 50S ribosomal protein L5 [Candidatus Pacebacteria bacterium]|nr:50S ribosomal protein L5 [Candidatus Paceibacterota bacterium]
MEKIKEKENKTFEVMKDTFGYSNSFMSPHVVKVVVNSSTGSTKDKHKIEVVQDRLTKITGQKPAPRGAKKSIATFKLREGDIIGYTVTLRGKMMYNFLDKLINIAIPRMRDFQGLPRESVDEMGNYTIGIKENTVFPETADEDLKNVFGFNVTIVTTAKTREEAEAFFEHIGIPLKSNKK